MSASVLLSRINFRNVHCASRFASFYMPARWDYGSERSPVPLSRGDRGDLGGVKRSLALSRNAEKG